MDKERCGTIPRVSIERALCQRNLLQLVSARERDLVYKCFGYRRGCGDEVLTLTINKKIPNPIAPGVLFSLLPSKRRISLLVLDAGLSEDIQFSLDK